MRAVQSQSPAGLCARLAESVAGQISWAGSLSAGGVAHHNKELNSQTDNCTTLTNPYFFALSIVFSS